MQNDRQYELNIALDDAINRAELHEVIKLLEDGADIEFRDPFGRTPLMNAAWVAADDIVEYLLSKNANASAVDKEGKSALKIVREIGHNEFGHNKVIKILEQATDENHR